MSFAEQSHEFVPATLSPLEPGQLWEATIRSADALSLESFDVRGRNPMIEFDFHNQLNNLQRREPADQEFRDRVARRRIISSAIMSGFEKRMQYEFALEDTDSLSEFTDELNFEEGSLAIRSIRQQLITRRDQSFKEQIVKLNQYVQEDSAGLTVLLVHKLDSSPGIPDYAFANLESFYIADNDDEHSPKPGLIISGKDGMRGIIPTLFHPCNLYVEYSGDQTTAEAAARQTVVRPPR